MIEKWNLNNFSSFLFKCNLISVGFYCSLHAAVWLHERYIKWSKRNAIEDAIFTGYEECKKCYFQKSSNCNNQYCYNYTLKKVKSLIDGAKHSLYICMNIFTSTDMSSLVLDAHKRGVEVKIIANESTSHATGSQLPMLHRSGKCGSTSLLIEVIFI